MGYPGGQKVLRVEVESLESTVTTMENSLANINELLKQMRAKVETLNESWAGPNHDTFMADFEACREDIKVHGQAMSEFVAALKETAAYYREMDDLITAKVAAAVANNVKMNDIALKGAW